MYLIECGIVWAGGRIKLGGFTIYILLYIYVCLMMSQRGR